MSKNKMNHLVYKPFMSFIKNLVNQHEEKCDYNCILDVTDCLLNLVQILENNQNGPSRKGYKKMVEHRRRVLVDYDICDVMIKILQFGLVGFINIDDEDGDIDFERERDEYLDIMRNGCEIMYYITRTEQILGASILDFMEILIRIFGKLDDQDLKCDILWTFQNISTNKKCIRHIINSSIIDYSLSILLSEQNKLNKEIVDNEHENENAMKKNIIRACFLIFENVSCGSSEQLGVICASDFLRLQFEKFMNHSDDKIGKNVIYTLRAITDGLYYECKKYHESKENSRGWFWMNDDAAKVDEDFYKDVIQFTVPKLCRLLDFIEDWSVIENILWVLSYVVIDNDWAHSLMNDENMSKAMENIIQLLNRLSLENSDTLKESVIKNIVRGGFIIIRRIANHSDFLAKAMMKFKVFDINLNTYLLHNDGQVITNTAQAIKSLLKVIDDIDIEIKQDLLNVSDGILSSLISILYFDDGLILKNGDYYDGNTQIRMESTLDILDIFIINKDSDGFNIAKAIAEAGGLDKLQQIQQCTHFQSNIIRKSKELREIILSKFVNFVLDSTSTNKVKQEIIE